ALHLPLPLGRTVRHIWRGSTTFESRERMAITVQRTAEDVSAPTASATRVSPLQPPRARRQNRLTRAWSRTPGRLALIMAGLLALVAVLAGVTVTTANTKTDATWELAERHEPTAADVQRLYRALSEADA